MFRMVNLQFKKLGSRTGETEYFFHKERRIEKLRVSLSHTHPVASMSCDFP